ncbi:MAG: NfeD family protein [Oscillospiraceae bacterium]|nr:NfeD family protein [Oscillospiraceae bacterium]
MDTIIWLVLMIAFLIAEAATVVTISLWFAGGALVALVASLLGAPLWLQVTLFFLVSAILLGSLRGIVKKHFTPKLERTNVDAIIGSSGYVTAEIDNIKATGTVKLGAMEWSARATAGAPIAVGTLVKVDKIEGVKVFVTPAEVPAEV